MSLIDLDSLRTLQRVYPGLTISRLALPAVIFINFVYGVAVAQAVDTEAPASPDVVSYEADFFTLYQPSSALEMVRRIPGFQLNDGEDKRGFGAAAGNILINDRYPSTKQDKPSSILERIPASQVQRINLIRAQTRDIDLRGQSVVASIILREDIPATNRWDMALRKNFNHRPVTVRSSISRAHTWNSFEYNAGIALRRFRSQELGPEELFDSTGVLTEARYEDTFLRGDEGSANLNVLTWLGKTLLNVNALFAFEDRSETLDSVSVPPMAGSQDDFFIDSKDQHEVEFGIDAERSVSPNLLAKGIFLFTEIDKNFASEQNRFDFDGARTLFRMADGHSVESETIARMELDWARSEKHAIGLDIEGARNIVDNELIQTVDTGTGPVELPVPGANTRVQEDRADLLLSATWTHDAVVIDYGIGAETSTIKQAGDAVTKRSFSFIKPQLSIAYSPTSRRQTRMRVAREVSQLDFFDFVTSTVFEDDDIALGNPNLTPESTWILELSEERRVGDLGVFKAVLFYHWISDVEDLLPLSPEFEAPGNIGDGTRWGTKIEATIPLDNIGLTSARFDIEARWQKSEVTDPVTGLQRELSSSNNFSKPLPLNDENRWSLAVNFRQDIESAMVAWGWDVRRRADRFSYRVDELLAYEDGYELNVFIETTRWLGLKVRLEGLNLLDFDQDRYRTFFTGERGLSSIDAIEVRNRTDGKRALLTISGSF